MRDYLSYQLWGGYAAPFCLLKPAMQVLVTLTRGSSVEGIWSIDEH